MIDSILNGLNYPDTTTMLIVLSLFLILFPLFLVFWVKMLVSRRIKNPQKLKIFLQYVIFILYLFEFGMVFFVWYQSEVRIQMYKELTKDIPGHLTGQLVDKNGKPCPFQNIFLLREQNRHCSDCMSNYTKISDWTSDQEGRFDIKVPNVREDYHLEVLDPVSGKQWIAREYIFSSSQSPIKVELLNSGELLLHLTGREFRERILSQGQFDRGDGFYAKPQLAFQTHWADIRAINGGDFESGSDCSPLIDEHVWGFSLPEGRYTLYTKIGDKKVIIAENVEVRANRVNSMNGLMRTTDKKFEYDFERLTERDYNNLKNEISRSPEILTQIPEDYPHYFDLLVTAVQSHPFEDIVGYVSGLFWGLTDGKTCLIDEAIKRDETLFPKLHNLSRYDYGLLSLKWELGKDPYVNKLRETLLPMDEQVLSWVINKYPEFIVSFFESGRINSDRVIQLVRSNPAYLLYIPDEDRYTSDRDIAALRAANPVLVAFKNDPQRVGWRQDKDVKRFIDSIKNNPQLIKQAPQKLIEDRGLMELLISIEPKILELIGGKGSNDW